MYTNNLLLYLKTSKKKLNCFSFVLNERIIGFKKSFIYFLLRRIIYIQGQKEQSFSISRTVLLILFKILHLFNFSELHAA